MAEIMDIRDDTAKDTSSSKAASPTASMKRVVLAGGIGTVIEFFDFGIYSFLATILAANFFPKQDPTAGLIATFAVFGVAYVVRPLGGIWLSSPRRSGGTPLCLGPLSDNDGDGNRPSLAFSRLTRA